MALVFTFGSLLSCSSVKEGTNTDAEKEGEESPAFGDITEYVVIRPDKPKKFETDAAVELRNEINKKYNCNISITTDWIKRDETAPEDTKEILVGLTNREAEDSPARSLSANSYYLAFDGKKLHIVADNELSMLYAIYTLMNDHMTDKGIDLNGNFNEVVTLNDAQLAFIRERSDAAKYIGLADTLDEEDKTHGDYKLIWSEEFSDSSIDKKVWNYEYGYIANNELQGYTDREKNAFLNHDCLVIQALEEKYKEFGYTSARLNTKGKFNFKYGYIEMRAILPEGKGIWPAFWMMGESGGWPACGEIDIMEMVGGGAEDDHIYGTIHYGTTNPYNHQQMSGNTQSKADLSEGFHTYGLEWTDKKITWYLDGVKYYSCGINADGFEMFRQNYFIIINLAVGGDWPGSPDKTTEFPQQYVIDYIRVYQ